MYLHAYMHLQKIQCTVLGWGWGGLNSVTLNQFSTPFDWRWFRQISIFDLARSGPQSSPLTAGLFSLFHVSLQYCFIPPSPEGMWQAEVGPCRTVLGGLTAFESNPHILLNSSSRINSDHISPALCCFQGQVLTSWSGLQTLKSSDLGRGD